MIDREKAIEILQRLADEKAEELDIFDDEGGDVCGQILEEQDAILAGIEALKERPHGEWIYHKYDIELGEKIGFKKGYEQAKKEFERPHGEWIQDFTMDTATICSKCGEKAWYKEYSGWVTESNFCPNCGADLREGEQNEISRLHD